MQIAGITKSSLLDYPGLISCVLFVPGCNFDCFYCHNRELISGKQKLIPLREIMDFLTQRTGFLDGVVITGGEPTLQPNLLPFIREVRRLGFKIKLDTNGSSPHVIAKLLDERLCDYYAVDYKAPSDEYKEICRGWSNAETVRETINQLIRANVFFEIRTTVIPQFTSESLLGMAGELPVVPKWTLNRYRRPELFKEEDIVRIDAEPHSRDKIADFAALMKTVQPNATT
jgi:pyruvate formate lyase activating enzyme